MGGFRGVAFEAFAFEVLRGGVTEVGIAIGVVEGIGTPGGRVLGGAAAAVVDFADRSGVVAVILEVLREGEGVGQFFIERVLQCIDLGGVRPESGQDADARRPADGLLAIGLLKQDAALRQSVDIRRFHVGGAVAAQLDAQVIHRHEQDIHRGGVDDVCKCHDSDEKEGFL